MARMLGGLTAVSAQVSGADAPSQGMWLGVSCLRLQVIRWQAGRLPYGEFSAGLIRGHLPTFAGKSNVGGTPTLLEGAEGAETGNSAREWSE